MANAANAVVIWDAILSLTRRVDAMEEYLRPLHNFARPPTEIDATGWAEAAFEPDWDARSTASLEAILNR